MKVIILSMMLAAAGLLDAHVIHELSDAQKLAADQYKQECIEKTGVNPEEIAEVNKGNYENHSEVLKKFTYCYFQKSGIIGADGTLNMETALAKQPPGVDKAEAAKVLEGCKEKIETTPVDTTFEIFKCYHTNIKTPQSAL